MIERLNDEISRLQFRNQEAKTEVENIRNDLSLMKGRLQYFQQLAADTEEELSKMMENDDKKLVEWYIKENEDLQHELKQNDEDIKSALEAKNKLEERFKEYVEDTDVDLELYAKSVKVERDEKARLGEVIEELKGEIARLQVKIDEKSSLVQRYKADNDYLKIELEASIELQKEYMNLLEEYNEGEGAADRNRMLLNRLTNAQKKSITPTEMSPFDQKRKKIEYELENEPPIITPPVSHSATVITPPMSPFQSMSPFQYSSPIQYAAPVRLRSRVVPQMRKRKIQ